VDEQPLDERGLAVADGLAVERVLLGDPAMDLDVLVRVVEEDVSVGLGDGEGADLFFRGAAAVMVAMVPESNTIWTLATSATSEWMDRPPLSCAAARCPRGRARCRCRGS